VDAMAGYQEADLFGDDENDDFDINTPIDGGLALDGMNDSSAALQESNEADEFGDEALLSFLGDEAAEFKKAKAAGDAPFEAGEKADDAVDYEDFSDDELPDEQPAAGGPVQAPYQLLSGIQEAADAGPNTPDGMDTFMDDEDLFGASSPVAPPDDASMLAPFGSAALATNAADAVSTPAGDEGDKDSLASEHEDAAAPKPSILNTSAGESEDKDYLLQLALFQGKAPPDTQQENLAEWVRLEFPDFEEHETPYFNRLFPPRPHRWVPEKKDNQKPPKPIRPTKVILEVEADQRLLFNSVVGAGTIDCRSHLVHIDNSASQKDADDLTDESDDDEPLPGGITLEDLDFMCTDFDTLTHDGMSDNEHEVRVTIVDSDHVMDEFGDFEQPRKKRKIGLDARDIVAIHQYELPSLSHPERTSARLAAKPILDLNDTQLLVEEVDADVAKVKVQPGVKTKGPQTVANRLIERFRTSNDEEYEMLKQNHQQKVRGQLGHINIEHSMPAVRLQYPYFQVQLPVQELRNWHRKKLHFKGPFTFSKPAKHKRKELKKMESKAVYKRSKDLSMGDNSTAVLFEYSEEHPTMLSSTGMGNKVVNFYRRKTTDDTTRPKHEIGELNVLLPEDRSPFNLFGHVDPGEEVTALVNTMYKAPLFEQSLQPEDFLIIRETTGEGGQQYFARNVDSTFVVGQEQPTKVVPGVTSRNVTSASKYRLRAIAYRIARRRKHNRIRVEDITKHFPESTDMQNRQKMKEFMKFNKEYKEWEMGKEHEIASEDTIQSLLQPDDIALLEAKDVGNQYLRDAGIEDVFNENNDDDKDDPTVGNESTEQLLAPWRATKNFVLANQRKAMLVLFGEGDPSGRGEAYSFLKTSMKGGFRVAGAPVADTVQAKKELGGHKYNVNKQDKDYTDSIRAIWNKQRAALSSAEPPSDPSLEGDIDTREDNLARQSMRATPRETPGLGRRIDDETGTSFSRRSATSQSAQKVLRIKRTTIVNGVPETQVHIETDPATIKAYVRRKEMHAANNLEYIFMTLSGYIRLTKTSLSNLTGPSGNAVLDAKTEEMYVSLRRGIHGITLTFLQNQEETRTARTQPRSQQKARKQKNRCWLTRRRHVPEWRIDPLRKTDSTHIAQVCKLWSGRSHQDQQKVRTPSLHPLWPEHDPAVELGRASGSPSRVKSPVLRRIPCPPEDYFSFLPLFRVPFSPFRTSTPLEDVGFCEHRYC
jgi:transcription initiation factor TFIID subunit 1, fungi type